MAACGSEKDRDEKGHDRAEEDPPGKFHEREPVGLLVEFRVENVGNLIRQAAQDRDDDEAGDHGEDVAPVVAASSRQHSGEKDTEERSVGVSKNAEHDRDDSDVGVDDHEIRRRRRDDDHEDGKPDGRQANGPQALFVGGSRIDIGLIPIARETGGECVQGRAERSHGGRENSGKE